MYCYSYPCVPYHIMFQQAIKSTNKTYQGLLQDFALGLNNCDTLLGKYVETFTNQD